jgi:hypothetical protein
VTVSRSKVDLFWIYDRHGYIGKENRVNLPLFRQKWRAFGDFRRSHTTADAANSLELQVKLRRMTFSDSRHSAQIGYMIRDGIR